MRVTLPRKATSAALMALLMFACCSFARSSASAALRVSPRRTIFSTLCIPLASDFDGDSRVDRVSLQSNGFDKTVIIKFGNARASEFRFSATSADFGMLVGDDVDGDGDLDLVWLADRDQNSAVVLINDGRGDFTKAKDNAPYAAQISALLATDDPGNQQSFQAGRQFYSLTSSSFAEIAVSETKRLALPTARPIRRQTINEFSERSAFLTYLRKRGPPLLVS